VRCLCLAFRKLEGDVDTIRMSSSERSTEVRYMEASFRSELDKIQLSIRELGNNLRRPCIAGRSPTKQSSSEYGGETTDNDDSGCQTEAKQSTNMQAAVQECTQRLGHVELDIVHVKDEIKAPAVALERLHHDYKVQQTLLKVDGSHTRQHQAMTLNASNHGTSVEIKARRQDGASHRTASVAPLMSHSASKTLQSAAPAARVSPKSRHEGTVSIRVAAAPDPTTTLQQQPHQPQQGQQPQQPLQPLQQPQHHWQTAAAATLAPLTAWRWGGLLSTGAVPTAAHRQLSPSNSHASVPPQLNRDKSTLAILKPGAFSKLANPTAALGKRDCVSSPELHYRA